MGEDQGVDLLVVVDLANVTPTVEQAGDSRLAERSQGHRRASALRHRRNACRQEISVQGSWEERNGGLERFVPENARAGSWEECVC